MGTKQLANCRDYYFEKSMKVVFYIQGAWHFPKMVPTMVHSPAFLITCMTCYSPSIRHPLSSTWGLAGQIFGSEYLCHKCEWICSVCCNHSPILIHDIHCINLYPELSVLTLYWSKCKDRQLWVEIDIVSPGLQSELHDGYH